MCTFLSLVVSKSGKVYGDGSQDSHEADIQNNVSKDPELKDDKEPPNNTFARVEVFPEDKDIFNHKLSNWKVKIDEKIIPKWWNKIYEKKCFKRLEEVFKTQFLIGGEYDVIDRDIRFVKNATIKVLKSTVQKVLDGGTVQKVLGGGTVQKVLGGGTVQEVWGGTVQEVWGGGTIIIFYSEKSFLQLKTIKNGNNVLIKKWLRDVEVVIK